MKKALIILSIFTFIYAKAQVNTKGTKQLMFSIFTGNAQLVYKQYIKDGFALRYSIRGNYKYNKDFNYENYEQQYGYTNDIYSYSFNLSLGIGFQKSLIKIDDKIDIYAGVDFFLGNKYYKSIVENVVKDSILTNNYGFRNQLVGDYKKSKIETPLSITLDAVPFVGFKYFFHPRLAFGAECRMSLMSVFFIPVTYYTNENVYRGIYTTNLTGSRSFQTGIAFDLNTAANITITLLLNSKIPSKNIETEKL